MPYKIRKAGSKYKVVNTATGKAKSKGTTKAKATRQMRLLYGIKHGWKPTRRK